MVAPAGFIRISVQMGLTPEEATQQYPLACQLRDNILRRLGDELLFAGVAGSQGSGKSTLTAQLIWLLQEQQIVCAHASIDDFYLTRAERLVLAERVHPLFLTRGVPGTHDMKMLADCLAQLRAGGSAALPQFDKLQDDRRADPIRTATDVKVFLLEGWCVGAPPLDSAGLTEPLNQLEAEEDGDGHWRTTVATALASDAYQQIFDDLQYLIFLAIPDFSHVRHWRGRQEIHLAVESGEPGMSEAELDRFVAHYERVTCHMLKTLPASADAVIAVDANHQLQAPVFRA